MLQALWWLCRAGAAWQLLPAPYPPRQTIGSRLERWVLLGVLERALSVLNGCLRLARSRRWWPTALDRGAIKPRHAKRENRTAGRLPRLRCGQEGPYRPAV